MSHATEHLNSGDFGILGRIDDWAKKSTNLISTIGVFTMLSAAGVMSADILMRWLFGGGVIALNEITGMLFVIAITACIPSGLASRGGISIDFISGMVGPRVTRVLEVLGSVLLLSFIAVLAWRLWIYAQMLDAQNRTTSLLHLPQAPFFYIAGVLMILGAVVQLIVALRTLQIGARADAAPMQFRLMSLAAILATAVVFGAFFSNFDALQGWALAHVGLAGAAAFVVLWIFLVLTVPLAVSIGFVGLGATMLFTGIVPGLKVMGTEMASFLTNYQIATLPLFLLMGSFAAVAGIGDDIYRISQAIFGRFRGGLAISTIGGCAGFGAVTGTSLSTVAMFGKIALPQMRERGYAPQFSAACVAAGGTLGALIPPSSILVLYALLTEVSLGRLFVAAIIPGLLAALLYVTMIGIQVRLQPDIAPAAEKPQKGQLRTALSGSFSFFALFGIVIGGLYSGVFTSTESAAVGAFGGFLIALLRGRLKGGRFWEVMGETTQTTALIYVLVFGVVTFSFFMAISNLPAILTGVINSWAIPNLAVILILLLVLIVLGCIMDSVSILMITTPILLPVIQQFGYDVVWWGIISLIIVEMGVITPPFGLHLFLLRAMDTRVRLIDLYKSVSPFILADIIRILLLIMFPGIALWLTTMM